MATQYGTAGSLAGMGLGALLAAPTGGLSIPMGAMLGATGGGIFGSLFDKQEAPQWGYDVVTMPQYDFTEPRLSKTSNYYSQGLDALSRGELPLAQELAINRIKEGMRGSLYRDFWGDPGNRTGNAFELSKSLGASQGIGEKPVWAQTNRQFANWVDRNNQIDTYAAGLGYNAYQNAANTIPQFSMQMPRGPETQIVPYGSNQISTGNQNLSSLAGLAGSIPWNSMSPQNYNMGGGGWSQYGNVYGSNTPYGVYDTGTYSRLPGK